MELNKQRRDLRQKVLVKAVNCEQEKYVRAILCVAFFQFNARPELHLPTEFY